MGRQHATPILIDSQAGTATALTPLSLAGGDQAVSEAAIQSLIFEHPECLPVAEIDPLFSGVVPLCTELTTAAGPIDILMVTPSGLPVLVECKLWRNPEGRREVVGQILDYAKELSRWTSSDLQREVGRRLKRPGNVPLDLVRAAGHEVDEIDFNDALTLNLRRGRFLLLIVGDGIREGVEAIAEYLQGNAGLHFTLGLVELPIFVAPSGDRLVIPRVLARTVSITREVVAAPEGYSVIDSGSAGGDGDELLDENTVARVQFLRELVAGPLTLDPDQPTPRPTEKGYLALYMPAPASSAWISISVRPNRVGLWLTSNRNTVGEAAIRLVAGEWNDVRAALGGTVALRELSEGRFVIEEFLAVSPFANPSERERAIQWLRNRMTDFVAVLRPRIKDAVERLRE